MARLLKSDIETRYTSLPFCIENKKYYIKQHLYLLEELSFFIQNYSTFSSTSINSLDFDNDFIILLNLYYFQLNNINWLYIFQTHKILLIFKNFIYIILC